MGIQTVFLHCDLYVPLYGLENCLIAFSPGNILILGGNINIQPKSRTTVSYEFLSQLVAEYLLKNSPDVDVSAALSIMPHTQSKLRRLSVERSLTSHFAEGMDLNPLFTPPDVVLIVVGIPLIPGCSGSFRRRACAHSFNALQT